ncbi:DUF4886 domain-containing protein [Proteiniphilum sp.]|uniref:DUF4886 domain-containing protein n=1 Tax=Proteiniphilum sp. TaxID=1926877 RepID=UPI002B1FF0EA|nr:DUF4886 domain-containing protein [Proteiniphilum sp.]MEA4917772.1 DUF4886 domain-containing protein [Proteiniphilum sp.]
MLSKKVIFPFLFFLFLTSIYAKEIKVLAIGNSFSDDALEHYLYQIGAANGDTLIIGNLAIAGASLEMHNNNARENRPAYSYRKIVNGIKEMTGETTLEQGIKDEDWDFISLQQVSSNAGVYESFFPYLPRLIDYVKQYATNPDMQLTLHMTWGYAWDVNHPGFANYNRDPMLMYDKIVETARRVSSELNIPVVVPAGTAIQNARTSRLGDSLFRDGYHLELTFGRYTAACAWYEILTGKCVVGTNYRPDTVDESVAFIAQISAHFAVINPSKITNIPIL